MADIVIPSPAGQLFADKSVEDLDALLRTMTPDGEIPGAPPDEPAPEPQLADPEPTPTPEPEPVAAAPEPTPEPEVDLAALETEGERLKREKLEAELKMQQAHSSRLAGEIGYLKEQLKSIPRPSEPYEPQSEADLDRLTQLERRIAQSESERQRSMASQAFQDAVGRLDGDWSVKYKDEIAQVVPKYADQIKMAQEISDPTLARQMGEALVLSIKAEALQVEWEKRHKDTVERKAATVNANLLAKKAQSPSGSGAVAPPPPKQKSYADMTPAEADAWLRENVR